MADAIKEQSPCPGSIARPKLRHPLRSATKTKNDNSGLVTAEIPNSTVLKRGKPASKLSKSVSVLDHSVKDKSAKSTRRLSVPSKSTSGSLPRSTVAITPISETRTKRSTNGLGGKSETPVSGISKPVNKRKFSVLSSASYWLSQIKISESAAKHSISVAFFKLALESGCEPLQRMKDELKSYAGRHKLSELGEPVKELLKSYNILEDLEKLQPLQRMKDELKSYARRHKLSELGEPVKALLKSYNILEDLEKLQVSESCSLVLEEGTESPGEVPSSSVATSTVTKKLRPKPLNTGSTQASSVAESAKEGARKKYTNGNQVSINRSSTKLKSSADKGAYNPQKKPQRPSKQEINKEKAKTKNEGHKSLGENDLVDSLPAEKTQQEDKENLDAQLMEQISSTH